MELRWKEVTIDFHCRVSPLAPAFRRFPVVIAKLRHRGMEPMQYYQTVSMMWCQVLNLRSCIDSICDRSNKPQDRENCSVTIQMMTKTLWSRKMEWGAPKILFRGESGKCLPSRLAMNHNFGMDMNQTPLAPDQHFSISRPLLGLPVDGRSDFSNHMFADL